MKISKTNALGGAVVALGVIGLATPKTSYAEFAVGGLHVTFGGCYGQICADEEGCYDETLAQLACEISGCGDYAGCDENLDGCLRTNQYTILCEDAS